MSTEELAAETERIIACRGGLNASLIRDSLVWLNDRGQADSTNREAFVAGLVFRPMGIRRS